MFAFLPASLAQLAPQTFDFGVIAAVIVLFSAAVRVIKGK